MVVHKICQWLDKNFISGIQIRDNGNIYPCVLHWILLEDDKNKLTNYNTITLEQIQSIRQKLVDEINEGKHPECQQCRLLYQTDDDNAQIGPIKHLVYHPHTLCSLNCSYCFYTDEQRSIPIAEEYKDLYKTIKHFYDIGFLNKETFSLDLGGGEPLFLDNIDKTIEFMSENWEQSTFYLLSNSTVVQKVDDFICKTKDKYSNVKKVLITSIDAGTARTFKLVRNKDYFYQVARNLYQYALNNTFDNIVLKYIFLDDLTNASDDDIFGFLKLCQKIRKFQKNDMQISIDIDWKERKYTSSSISDNLLKIMGKMYYIITEILKIEFIFASDYLSEATDDGKEAIKKIKEYSAEYKNSKKSYRDQYEFDDLLKNDMFDNQNLLLESKFDLVKSQHIEQENKLSQILNKNIEFDNKLNSIINENIILKQSLYKVLDIVNKDNFIKSIFSVKNSKDKSHKIIKILGFKIKIKRECYDKK